MFPRKASTQTLGSRTEAQDFYSCLNCGTTEKNIQHPSQVSPTAHLVY